MDKTKIQKKLSDILEDVEALYTDIQQLESELRLPKPKSCNCEVEYTGTHTLPCRGYK